jgi:hypothetical protein
MEINKLQDKINHGLWNIRRPINYVSDIFSGRGYFELPMTSSILMINIGDHISRRVDSEQNVMYRVRFILYYYELVSPNEL